VLAAAILGSSMAFLDGTVVNVALPVMQRDLRATVEDTQWIVEAYALLLASLVLVGGALGDRLGRRRVFSWGVALFALASAGCAAAPDMGLLVAARALQGVGAALLVPGSLALISAAYPAEARGAAIGTWSAGSAITAAVGPVAGGWVVGHASWRWLFVFNLPLAVAVLVLCAWRIPESRDDSAPARPDVFGALLATAGLGVIVYALLGAGHHEVGIGSARVVRLLLLGVLTLAAFVVFEALYAAPMVPLALFRSRTFAGANLLTMFLYAALGAALFFVPFNLIQVQGYAPAAAGASLLPLVLLMAALSPRAGALAARIGPRPLLVGGPLVAAGGFALLALPGLEGSYVATFLPGIATLGLGMGLTVAPLTSTVMGAVDPRHAGVASGINNAVARAAALLAVAGLGALLVTRFNRVLDGDLVRLSLAPSVARAVNAQRARLAAADLGALDPLLREPLRRAFDAAFVAGFRALMVACAALAALAALAGFTTIERGPR
jgi:EmrB/QacA subfamily drug resistance transporter